MTKTEIKDFVTELLGGEELGDDLFDDLLKICKDNIEGLRPWIWLRTEGSVSVTSTNTYETAHTLPTNFKRTYGEKPLKLVATDNDDEVLEFMMLPFDQRRVKKDTNNRFVIDLKNNQFYILGTLTKAYTGYLYHIAKSADIDSDNDWVFPSEFHPYLAYKIAVSHKGGIDYDDINARMAQYNGSDSQEIWRRMINWDSELQRLELEGVQN